MALNSLIIISILINVFSYLKPTVSENNYLDETIEQGRIWPLPTHKSLFRTKSSEILRGDRDQWNQDAFEYSAMSKEEFNELAETDLAGSLFPLCKNTTRMENIYKLILSTSVLGWHTKDIGTVGEIKQSDQFKRLYDKCNNHIEQVNQLVKSATSKECQGLKGKKPYNIFYSAIVQAILLDLPYTQQNRMTKAFKQNAMLCYNKLEKFNYTVELGIWIIDNSKNYFKTIDEFVEKKQKTEMAWTDSMLIEYAYGLSLSEDEMENDKRMSQLIKWTSDLVNIANDLVTFEQAYNEANKRADRVFNMVGVIMVLDKCNEEQAMDRTVRYYADLENKTKKMMDEMIADPRVTKKQREFIKHLYYQIGASFWGNRN